MTDGLVTMAIAVIAFVAGVLFGVYNAAENRVKDCEQAGMWMYNSVVFECHPVEKAK